MEHAAICAGWAIALVAGVRQYVPKVDGPWVLLVAALAAILCSLVTTDFTGGVAWQTVLQTAGLAWIGAVGGVSFVNQTAAKLGRLS